MSDKDHILEDVGNTARATEAAIPAPDLCICAQPMPAAPLTWGDRKFCSMACFSAWYVLAGVEGMSESAPQQYRDYANHVACCLQCTAAITERQLCQHGGALFDALDDDPTDPGYVVV